MGLFQNFTWNPLEHGDAENLRWSSLRALEWGAWPAFISGPIVPLLLPFFEWWKVIGMVAVLTVLWSFIRYKYISLAIASFGAYFVLLKWVTCPAVALYLLLRHEYMLALLAVFWPKLSGLLGIFVGGVRIGALQEMFMNKLGYLKNRDTL